MDGLHPALGTVTSPSQASFLVHLSTLFSPIENPPEPGDYLQINVQNPQAYSSFKLFNIFTPIRNCIYLLPLSKKVDSNYLAQLGLFIQAFYLGARVKVLEAVDLRQQAEKQGFRMRDGFPRQQFLTQDVLTWMKKLVPEDAYGVMGVADEDLYPNDKGTFVFGWALYVARVGLFSYCRWDNDYFEGEKSQPNYEKILYPSLRTVIHELGHMFGISHCVYYRCMMSGFHSIFQNYRAPFELCPVCFRKVIANLAFNPVLRYQALLDCVIAFGFQDQIKLYQNLLQDFTPYCDGWWNKTHEQMLLNKAANNIVKSQDGKNSLPKRSPSNQNRKSAGHSQKSKGAAPLVGGPQAELRRNIPRAPSIQNALRENLSSVPKRCIVEKRSLSRIKVRPKSTKPLKGPPLQLPRIGKPHS